MNLSTKAKRVMMLLAAATMGILAQGWLDPRFWGVPVAIGAVWLVLARPREDAGRRGQTWLLVCLAIATLTASTAGDLWRFSSSSWVRVWNVYHYYLGAKYFEELGYRDLYVASLQADREGDNYWSDIPRVRDLKTYQRVRRSVAETGYEAHDHFSPLRWQEFQRDVSALQKQLPARDWRPIFTDRGYNPSPLWTALGGTLAGFFPADQTLTLKLLGLLDFGLLATTFWCAYRAFGPRAAALLVLFFALSPVNQGRIVGGFLQFDWLCAIVCGFCQLRRERPVSAAALLAYAVMSRSFPLLLVAAAGLPVVWRWIASGRIRRTYLRFAVGLASFCVLAFGVGCLAGGGLDAWSDFAGNLHHHAEEHRFGERRVGLQHVFTHDLRSFEFDESSQERRSLFTRQKGLYLTAAAVFLGLFFAVTWRRNVPDAFIFGLVPLFVLVTSSRYYWACLALLPLLARAGPRGRSKGRFVDAAQASLYGLYFLWTLQTQDRFAAYSIFNLLLGCLLLSWMGYFLLSDLRVWRRRFGVPARHRSLALAVCFFAVLFILLSFLRMPSPDHPIRDVDEAVSALIAESWLDGGIPYRDAIDQRGPVTYVIYALVFAVAGVHNMAAIHWALLAVVWLGCWLVWQLGRRFDPRPEGIAAAYLAAFILALACSSYRRSQFLAFHTEWPVLLASGVAMLCLWRGMQNRSYRLLIAAGAAFAVGFLGKQPAIFDAAAGGLFFLLWRWRNSEPGDDGGLWHRSTLYGAASMAGGFFGLLAMTIFYFWAAGALHDFYYYFWQYNVEHYTAVVSWQDRLASLNPFAHRRHVLTAQPLLLVAIAWQSGRAAVRLLRRGTVDPRLLVVLWALAGYFGASYSGRNFGHYFIQILLPASLLASYTVVDAWRRLTPRTETLRDMAWAGRLAVIVVTSIALYLPLQRFHRDLAWPNLWREAAPKVLQENMLAFIRGNSSPEDTIFVWGYFPEIYVLAPRQPATRFSNANYLTGLLPWENSAPEIDTSAHIVPGARELLLQELENSRPALVFDMSVGNHRDYGKYPLTLFPELATWLHQNYRPTLLISNRRGQPGSHVWVRRAGG